VAAARGVVGAAPAATQAAGGSSLAAVAAAGFDGLRTRLLAANPGLPGADVAAVQAGALAFAAVVGARPGTGLSLLTGIAAQRLAAFGVRGRGASGRGGAAFGTRATAGSGAAVAFGASRTRRSPASRADSRTTAGSCAAAVLAAS